MRDKNKKNTEPTHEDEVALSDLMDNKPSFVEVRGKKWKCEYLYPGTERKVTSIMLDESSDEDKVTCKCAAVLRLNGLWKIKFFYPILWRWFYYIKQYTDADLLPFITECKKKVIVQEYLLNIMSLTAMKDTMMTKTRKEVAHIQAELLGAQLGVSQKNSQTSLQQNTTSEE